MEALGITGSLVAQWRPEQLLLVAEMAVLLAMIAANSRATALVYASEAKRRKKRLWLAAIWGLPFAGVVYLLVRGLRSGRYGAAASASAPRVDSTR